MLSKLQDIAKKAANAKAAYLAEAKILLTPALMAIFDAHPEVTGIRWSQYTPYFNDGEPCVFGRNGLEATVVSGPEADADEDSEEWQEVYSYNGFKVPDGFSSEAWSALVDLDKSLSGMEDVLEDAFGDHVRVFVTRDGIEIEEYDHD